MRNFNYDIIPKAHKFCELLARPAFPGLLMTHSTCACMSEGDATFFLTRRRWAQPRHGPKNSSLLFCSFVPMKCAIISKSPSQIPISNHDDESSSHISVCHRSCIGVHLDLLPERHYDRRRCLHFISGYFFLPSIIVVPTNAANANHESPLCYFQL